MDLATPLRYVSPEAPPFLILHGDRDATVPFAQSEALYEALERAGVPCELCTVEGADHATAEFSQVGLLRHIADWLDAALGKDALDSGAGLCYPKDDSCFVGGFCMSVVFANL